MHGEILKIRCTACYEPRVWEGALSLDNACNVCGTVGCLRPHIVWFGEMPFHMEEIESALELCDLFISVGTSGNVYPAAGFVQQVQLAGRGHTVELNLEPSRNQDQFNFSIHKPATVAVEEFKNLLIKNIK